MRRKRSKQQTNKLLTLPSYDQAIAAEALRYAKTELSKYFNAPTNPWSADPPMSEQAGRAFVRNVIEKFLLMNTVELRMTVIALARGGVTEAADALRHLVLELRSRRCELPIELEVYEMEIRFRGGDYWPKTSGPKHPDNLTRNVMLAWVVACVVDHFNLHPTQRSARTVSGCAVVAEATSEMHVHLSYETVKSTWKVYGRAMLTVPRWASKAVETK